MVDGKKSEGVGLQRKYSEGGVTGKGFKKGQSGNPSGKPKGAVSLTTILRRSITEDNGKKIVENLLELAQEKPVARKFLAPNGETCYMAIDPQEVKLHQWAVDTILERLDGKVTQPIGGDPDRPLTVNLVNNIAGLGNVEPSKDD